MDVTAAIMLNCQEPSWEDIRMTRPMTHPEIAADLQERIATGEYPVGQPIPSYRQVARLYSVSESTAGKAVTLLRERGLIEKWAGRGNVVRPEEDSPSR